MAAGALALALAWATAAGALDDCGEPQPIPEHLRKANGPLHRVVCNAASERSRGAFNGADGILYRKSAGLEIIKDDATPVQQIANRNQQGGSVLQVQAGAVVQQDMVSGHNTFDFAALYAWSSDDSVLVETAAGVSLSTETARREAVYARSGSLRHSARESRRVVNTELARIAALTSPSAEQIVRVSLGGPVSTSGLSANAVFAYAEEGGAVFVDSSAAAPIVASGAKQPGLADNRREQNNGYGIAAWSGLAEKMLLGPGGQVRVRAFGGVSTRAAQGAGIYARSGGGPVQVETRGAITTLGWLNEPEGASLKGMAPGIWARGFGADAAAQVRVDSRGFITTGMRGRPGLGAESHGIRAEAAGALQSAPVFVRAGAITTWPMRSHGIHASSLGAQSGGEVRVEAYGRIETRGPDSHGIFTQASHGETSIRLAPSAAVEAFGAGAAALRAESALPGGATGTPGPLRISLEAGALLAARGGAQNAIEVHGGHSEIEIAGLLHGAVQGGAGDDALRVLPGGAWTLLGDSDFGGGSNSLHNEGTLQVGRMHSLDALELRGLASFTQAAPGQLLVNIASRSGRSDLLDLGSAAVTLAGLLKVSDLDYAPGALTLDLLRTTGALDFSALRVERSAVRRSALGIVTSGGALQLQQPAPAPMPPQSAPTPPAGALPADSAQIAPMPDSQIPAPAPAQRPSPTSPEASSAPAPAPAQRPSPTSPEAGSAPTPDSQPPTPTSPAPGAEGERGGVLRVLHTTDYAPAALAADHQQIGAYLNRLGGADPDDSETGLLGALAGIAGMDAYARALDRLNPAGYGALLQSAWWAQSAFAAELLADCGADESADGRCSWLRPGARGLRRSAAPGEAPGERFGFAEESSRLSTGLRLPLPAGQFSLGAAVEQSELEILAGAGPGRTSGADGAEPGGAGAAARHWGEGEGLRLLAGAAFSSGLPRRSRGPRRARLELGGGIGGGYARHEISRRDNTGQLLQSAPRLHWAGGHLRAALHFAPGGWELRPHLEATALFAQAGNLAERGKAAPAGLAIADAEARWLALRPGLAVAGGIATPRGALRLNLALGARWFPQADAPRWRARLSRDSSTKGDFALRDGAPEALLAECALGLAWQGPRLSLRLDYQAALGAQTRLHSGGLRLRLRF